MRRSFTVPKELDGERLDKALAALAGDLSRRAAREALQRGGVYLEGTRCRTASRPVRAGTRIGLEEAVRPPEGTQPEVRILGLQGDLLALDKPGGVPLAPTRDSVEGTLLHALARSLSRPIASLHLPHRLDAPTSGVVLVALSPSVARFLGEAFREGRVSKTYLAWVAGMPSPPEGRWNFPLTPPRRGTVAVDPGGKPASTQYRVREARGADTLLELSPRTGRTHQLRVHCAAAGCPILGDRRYGILRAGVERALLHAWRIEFPLPGGGIMALEAPPPEDMERGAGE